MLHKQFSGTSQELNNSNCVLVVEDDPSSQEVLASLLEYYSMEVIVSSDGEEALKNIKNAPFDLIILDLGLPDMSGFELAVKIRDLQKVYDYTLCPILMNSGQVDENDEHKKYGITEFYQKPHLIENLEEILKKYFPKKV